MCNCKKNKYETKVIMATPEPIPTPQVIQLPLEDHFNNIDTIEPIQNGEGTTGENRES
jgi:hypothetical protein